MPSSSRTRTTPKRLKMGAQMRASLAPLHFVYGSGHEFQTTASPPPPFLHEPLYYIPFFTEASAYLRSLTGIGSALVLFYFWSLSILIFALFALYTFILFFPFFLFFFLHSIMVTTSTPWKKVMTGVKRSLERANTNGSKHIHGRRDRSSSARCAHIGVVSILHEKREYLQHIYIY